MSIAGYRYAMSTRQIRKRCQALVTALNLPRPFSVEALIQDLSILRGRSIQLHSLPSGVAAHACGLWIATDTADEIYVEDRTTQFHREHIALHEVGHILLDHGANDRESNDSLAKLLPDLSSELINRLLARANYSTEQEQEAELVASLICAAAGAVAPLPSSGVRGKLEVALGIRE
jgi:hypothetical protein